MTAKELIVTLIRDSNDQVFRNARACPEDKLSWSVMDVSRTVLDMCQECAQAPTWGMAVIKNKGFSMPEPDAMAKFREERATWTTLDACEAKCRENTENLIAEIDAMPDEEFSNTVEIPFGKMTYTYAEVMLLQYWNNVYHSGQICFIQTLYGDKEMR